MIKRIFMNGLKAFVPVALTLAIVIWIFKNIESFFGHFLQYIIPKEYYMDGLGVVVGVIFIFIIGLLVNAWIIKGIYQWFEKWVKRIPLITTLYSSIQDLVSYFDRKKGAENNQTVVCRLGKLKVLGFVTRDTFEDLPNELGSEKEVLVYIPMSYMIGGIMVSLPRKYVTPIDMKVNQAMSLILTAGMAGSHKRS